MTVLSEALLAMLLQPQTRAAAAAAMPGGFVPHLSLLHSIAGLEVTTDWLPHGLPIIQRCNDQGSWGPTKQYYLAKFALWGVIEGLIERYHEDEVCCKIIDASCPSGCETNMGRNFPFFLKQILARALQQFIWGRTAEQGARTLVGATRPGPDNHGELRRNDELHP